MDTNKQICILTNGCPENRIDGARVQNFLTQNAFPVTNNYLEADIILFNACRRIVSLDIIRDLKMKKKPSAELIVYGCLPKVNKERLNDVYQGITFGSDEVENFNDIFRPTKIQAQDVHANYLLPCMTSLNKKWRFPKFTNVGMADIIPKVRRRLERGLVDKKYRRIQSAVNVFNPDSFLIKISTGCLNACSFCAIRFARGKLKSKPIYKVVEEFEEGLSKGYTEFGLVGTDLGSYGRDLGTNLAELLGDLIKKEGDYKIRLRNIQPRFLIDMLPMLTEIFRSGKIAYLESAVESGNNRILKLMRRGYSIENYKEAMRIVKQKIPGIKIRTQIIVGFPSETEEEFQDTVQLLDEINFDFIEIYPFGAYPNNPNTVAGKMKDQIPPKVKQRRYHELYMKAVSTCT